MTDPLLERAVAEGTISNRALGLYIRTVAIFRETGKMPTLREIQERQSDGYHSLRMAQQELVDLGLVTSERVQKRDGRWTTEVRFSDLGEPDHNLKYLITTSSTNSSVIENPKFPSGTWPRASHAAGKGRRRSKVRDPGSDYEAWDEPTSEEKQATRARKYTKAPKVDRRSTRTVDQYSIPDLLAEFGERVAKVTKRSDQISFSGLSKRIGVWRKDGISQKTILAGMDLFFADKRNLHDIGQGLALWIRFASYFAQNQIRSAQASGDEKSSLDEMEERVSTHGALLIDKSKRRF